MRTAAGLAVLAAGAILTFAVSAQTPGINLRIAGVIIMVAGAIGMVPPARLAAWLRLPRAGHQPAGEPELGDAEEADDLSSAAYLLQDPAVLAAEVLRSAKTASAGSSRPGPGRAGTSRAGPARGTGSRPPLSIARDGQDGEA